MMTKEGRSVLKTKKRLRESLTQLLKTKSIKHITIRELTELSELNRGTFYLHYKDIYDMLEQIEDELFEEFDEILRTCPISQQNGELPVIREVFQFIAKNADIRLGLLGKNGDIAFNERLRQMFRDKCFRDWEKQEHGVSAEDFEIFYAYSVAGCVGLLEQWLQGEMKRSPEEMAQLMEKMILKGLGAIA